VEEEEEKEEVTFREWGKGRRKRILWP